ncbi:AraC family transcriptional regulator of adaptative response / DNA-3-methyladenine glycosylase II [Luteibacter sp. Sphag1AF]|uniref:DNA-3-methyladenine glycosylase 2 family protein n=1 Tax=Luteibacter sp. Sphag1AF TaxID=2587031 RepID=UPI0016203037|nr:DNA-3-methyladenine glycosylase 2 [Luteibacter sp. Sphag1AF]MBB3225473.1 AraC family transcriptional regulator of adaptative response / DNA-3-methyladenine glycosylase II [Luteibacter sp. Sphag1AF]
MTPDQATRHLPDTAICEAARLSRDARFDGLFFTAVTSTGIYCRPVCPAPAPKPSNVVYFANAAAAQAAGFRPCLRCRPELSPADGAWRRGDTLLARALKLLESDAMHGASLDALSAQLSLSSRQLRRLFVERLGVSPIEVRTTQRLLFAKQLLTETAMPITEVALASGFGSLRRFNAAFAHANHIQPRELRRHPRAVAGEPLVLRLAYRPPYDLDALLQFLATRALPGIEKVDDTSYARVFGPADRPGWLRVSAWPDGSAALRLELHCPDTARLQDIVIRLRRLFDLDADPAMVAATFEDDPVLGPAVRRRPGLRLPGGWDGFEIAVRAILGQQVSVAAARTLATRLVDRYGQRIEPSPLPGLDRLFPEPAVLADVDLRDIGLTTGRAATINTVAAAVRDGRVDFRTDRTLDELVALWTALPGIGDWTAQYLAMRALGHPDAFPAADLILRRAASTTGEELSTRALTLRAQAWRPWRAYAVMHLWRLSTDGPAP